MTLLQMTALLLAGVAIGYVARDLRPQFWPHTGLAQIVVGPQSDGTMSLQINLEGRSLGWIALTPQTRRYLETKLSELPAGTRYP